MEQAQVVNFSTSRPWLKNPNIEYIQSIVFFCIDKIMQNRTAEKKNEVKPFQFAIYEYSLMPPSLHYTPKFMQCFFYFPGFSLKKNKSIKYANVHICLASSFSTMVFVVVVAGNCFNTSLGLNEWRIFWHVMFGCLYFVYDFSCFFMFQQKQKLVPY